MFDRGASGTSFASAVSAKSKPVLEFNDCCCRKTSASSCSALSASDGWPGGLSSAIVCASSLLPFACVRKSRAISRLLRYRSVGRLNELQGLQLALPRAMHSVLRTVPPGRFFIERRLREPAQGVNCAAIRHHRARREQRTRRLVHERHELVREARHRATDANPAHITPPAHSSHPSAL